MRKLTKKAKVARSKTHAVNRIMAINAVKQAKPKKVEKVSGSIVRSDGSVVRVDPS